MSTQMSKMNQWGKTQTLTSGWFTWGASGEGDDDRHLPRGGQDGKPTGIELRHIEHLPGRVPKQIMAFANGFCWAKLVDICIFSGQENK